MSLTVEHLGIRPYQEVWEYQRSLRDALINGLGEERLLLCQHPPVITLGTSAHRENILASSITLSEQGVELLDVERGGDVTWHAPGQLIAYPILNLRSRKTDVGWYMRMLEQSVIDTLSYYGIAADRVKGKTGVWVAGRLKPGTVCPQPFDRKICSMGVKISRWCTMHGLALNVQDCEWGFPLINPCGFDASVMTTMKLELGCELVVGEVEEVLAQRLLTLLEP